MSASVQRIISLVVFSIGVMTLATSAAALEGSWYVGAGAGVSKLSPDTDDSAFTLEDDESDAVGLYLGLDINRWLGVEAAYTDLGEATLSSGDTIEYKAASIGAIAYVIGSREAQSRQQGLSGFLRLGLNSVDNKSTVDLDQSDNQALWVGAGVQWPLSEHWGVRAELNSYDGDAQAAMASLYWRAGGSNGGTAAKERAQRARDPIATPPTSLPQVESAPVVKPYQRPSVVSEPASTVQKPAVATPRVTATSVAKSLTASCSEPTAGEPADKDGCALFSGVLQGVDFEPGTSRLTANAQTVLNSLSTSLKEHQDITVEIQAHTEATSAADAGMQLSRERTLSVARYLAGEGVSIKRLRARAYGSTSPRATNDTAIGRRLNNRIILRVL